ncbi:MAG: sigma-70 family RNA polymerase sigma factor [Saprospiraceae bacterium]|nr:sigma-70 family RNA polymerase sigma factor [Saprospiraceae bacterium]
MLANKKYIRIINGCKANDRRCQEELYKIFFEKMLSMCRRYTQDEDQQLTIINDGFLKVFKKIDTFKGEGSFEGWVRRLVFTSLSDYFRKENKYLKFMIFETPDSVLKSESEESLYYQDIINLIDLLPGKTKVVFQKYAIEGYTHKDIGIELGISEGTSKWHLSEARKKLQNLLKERNIYNSNVK